MKSKYQVVVRYEFEANDDIDARGVAMKLKPVLDTFECGFMMRPITATVATKLQRLEPGKPPARIEIPEIGAGK